MEVASGLLAGGSALVGPHTAAHHHSHLLECWVKGPCSVLLPALYYTAHAGLLVVVQAVQLGPIQWDSAHAQCQKAWAAGAAQQQQNEQDLQQERTVRLRGLLQADAELLGLLASCFARKAHCLPRALAGQLLSAPVTLQLLDVRVPYEAEVCCVVCS